MKTERHGRDETPAPTTADARLITFLPGYDQTVECSPTSRVIGVIPGSGIGPEVLDSALQVLDACSGISGIRFEVRRGGPIGEEAQSRFGTPLPDSVLTFCNEVFDKGGSILCGPGGGRFVYDLRRRLHLFCKLAPVRRWPALARVGPLQPSHVEALDILFVRDNAAGVYQGKWLEREEPAEGRVATHTFHYSEARVRLLTEVGFRAAAARRQRLHLIVKDGGIPGITALWRDVCAWVARRFQVEWFALNIDLGAYELIQQPRQFDVVLAPNLFGDVLIDLAAVLQGSRGVAVSANFSPEGKAVYQTNHGCANDLAGADVANPAAQVLALAMMLRESLGLPCLGTLIERAVSAAWSDGWRTPDVAEPGSRIVGTRAMTERIVEKVLESTWREDPSEIPAHGTAKR